MIVTLDDNSIDRLAARLFEMMRGDVAPVVAAPAAPVLVVDSQPSQALSDDEVRHVVAVRAMSREQEQVFRLRNTALRLRAAGKRDSASRMLKRADRLEAKLYA